MLIRDTNTLGKYAQISGVWNYDQALSTLKIVEQRCIVPILGEQLYTALDDSITDAAQPGADPVPDIFIKLLDKCRMVIGPLFCYYHADKADVLFSPSGMQRSESSTNKSAYQEQRSKYKDANLQEGEDAIEFLYQFLEEVRQGIQEWTGSIEFEQYRSLFIKTGSELRQIFTCTNPYRIYVKLQPHFYDVEQGNIRKFLGKELFNHLKEKDKNIEPDFSEEEIGLLNILKRAITYLALAKAVPLLNVQIGNNGLTMPATASFSTNDSDNVKNAVSDRMFSSYIDSCKSNAEDWMQQAEQYLIENKTDFENWIGFKKKNDDCRDLESFSGEGIFGL